MKKIDTTSWGDFRVGDLFDSERGKVKKLQILPEGPTPVVAAARSCQGVAGYYEVDAPYCNQITISCNGVGCGSSFYHNYPFNVNGDAIVLKEKLEIPEKAKLFISCMLDGVLFRKYSYEEKCSPQKVSDEIIKLPITADNKPDWEYMEHYMQQNEDGAKTKISLLNNIVIKPRTKIETTTWKRFKIGELFPEILKPEVYHTYQVTTNDNGIPYIVRSKFDNGMKYRVNNSNLKTSPAGVISFGAENSTFFYQEEEWCSGRDIYYIDTRSISPYACRFLITCLCKVATKYSYNHGLFPDLLKKDYVTLPVKSDMTPDWDYMEQYMETIERKTQTALSVLTI